MLVTTIEIWPLGDEESKRQIMTLKIANIGKSNPEYFDEVDVCDYAVVAEQPATLNFPCKRERWAYVRRFHRRRGAAALVSRAIYRLGYNK